MRTPAWIYKEYQALVINRLELLSSEAQQIPGDPGPWTARLCRYINNLPETEKSVIHCGKCLDYANPRKREKAANLPLLMPGFESIGGAHQLHPPCRLIRLRQLQTILRRLEELQVVAGYPLTQIPDTRQPRGWDYGTVWELIE